jgi:hypothetical protein
LQMLENKALSRGIIGKSAPILAEITIRKSQFRSKLHDYRTRNFRRRIAYASRGAA